MKIIEGGVTAAAGFLASAAEANIKYKGRNDMALVYSEVPAVCAGTFTTNVVKAAPVKWDMEIVRNRDTVQAVVLNSGIANAATGKPGEELNREMAKAVADELSVDVKDVLTASTGVIGMQLEKERLQTGAKLLVPKLAATKEAGTSAAEAIMTTDLKSKEYAVEIDLNGSKVTIGGMAKGSGMIHPNMATMLCVITTDAAVDKEVLQKMTGEIVQDTFNMISIDRDTSTNDTLLVLANAKAGNEILGRGKKDAAYFAFYEALKKVCEELAKKMAADGEGATKLFETMVIHAGNKEEAKQLAKSVITSNLVKTMIYGSDANCGRILCAMGYSGVSFNPDMVDLYVESDAGKLQLVADGMMTDYSEDEATRILSREKVTAIADLKAGEAEATAWGCDLTYDYIKINGDYRS